MRTPDDLAFRARNWVWYSVVRNAKGENKWLYAPAKLPPRWMGCSNEALDARFLGEGGRRRHFERIQWTAASPAAVALINGKKLLQIVDDYGRPDALSPGPYATATSWFQSKLWEYLSSKNFRPSDYSQHIQAQVAARDWLRLSAPEASLFRRFLGNDEAAVEPGVSTAYSAMLHKLVNEATPDAISVLIALFREAIHAVLLEEAIAIKKALGVAATWMCLVHAIPKTVERLLSQLIEDRVLADLWISESDWKSIAGVQPRMKTNTRDRMRDFQEFVSWYTSHPRSGVGTRYGSLPIVPRSARLDWVTANRVQLESQKAEIDRLEYIHFHLSDSWMPNSAEDAAVALESARSIASQISPPQEQLSRRFYESQPRFEITGLPKAYASKAIGRKL
jgi:hypothetical protein